MSIASSTISTEYDTVVIGAGPAGCIAARELARRGLRVALVEASAFPRWKVCGACMGLHGVEALRRMDLGSLFDAIGPVPITETELCWNGRVIRVHGACMTAVSRSSLDDMLASAAEAAGVEMHWRTTARIIAYGESARSPAIVRLSRKVTSTDVTAGSVMVACGLATARADPRASPRTQTKSHIGLGTVSKDIPNWLRKGVLHMNLGRKGYVGCVVSDDGQATWAAAISPAFLRESRSAAQAIRLILDESQTDLLAVPHDGWRGTPRLTRRTCPQTGRVYRIGDAAGYIEPITGEGMSWAISSAERAAAVVAAAVQKGRSHELGQWKHEIGILLRRRRASCRMVAKVLRSPLATEAAFRVAARHNGLARRVMALAIGSPQGATHA